MLPSNKAKVVVSTSPKSFRLQSMEVAGVHDPKLILSPGIVIPVDGANNSEIDFGENPGSVIEIVKPVLRRNARKILLIALKRIAFIVGRNPDVVVPRDQKLWAGQIPKLSQTVSKKIGRSDVSGENNDIRWRLFQRRDQSPRLFLPVTMAPVKIGRDRDLKVAHLLDFFESSWNGEEYHS